MSCFDLYFRAKNQIFFFLQKVIDGGPNELGPKTICFNDDYS